MLIADKKQNILKLGLNAPRFKASSDITRSSKEKCKSWQVSKVDISHLVLHSCESMHSSQVKAVGSYCISDFITELKNYEKIREETKAWF